MLSTPERRPQMSTFIRGDERATAALATEILHENSRQRQTAESSVRHKAELSVAVEASRGVDYRGVQQVTT